MIPALARWNGDHAIIKDTTKEAAGAAEALLFDGWFDAIEDGVRSRVRGFIETMLEAELSAALSRPRHGRRRPEEDEATPSVVVGLQSRESQQQVRRPECFSDSIDREMRGTTRSDARTSLSRVQHELKLIATMK